MIKILIVSGTVTGFNMAFLTVLLLAMTCSAFNINDLADIVTAVKHHFRSRCVCLLLDRDNGKLNL
jgi:hypothetical protein